MAANGLLEQQGDLHVHAPSSNGAGALSQILVVSKQVGWQVLHRRAQNITETGQSGVMLGIRTWRGCTAAEGSGLATGASSSKARNLGTLLIQQRADKRHVGVATNQQRMTLPASSLIHCCKHVPKAHSTGQQACRLQQHIY